MASNLGFIRNPLTIIGIFSTIIEGLCIVVLPHITDDNQSKFVWFVMFFPSLLLILFFFTLIRHHTKLYAPTDFSAEHVEFAEMYLNNHTINKKMEQVNLVPTPNDHEHDSQQSVSLDFIPFSKDTSKLTEAQLLAYNHINQYFTKLDPILPKHKFKKVQYEIFNTAFSSVTFLIKEECVLDTPLITYILNTDYNNSIIKYVIAGSGAGISENPEFTQNYILNNLSKRTKA